jgi:hypothetical protein
MYSVSMPEGNTGFRPVRLLGNAMHAVAPDEKDLLESHCTHVPVVVLWYDPAGQVHSALPGV